MALSPTSSRGGGGGAPSGAAGGDLGGTYPNPTVDLASGGTIAGTLQVNPASAAYGVNIEPLAIGAGIISSPLVVQDRSEPGAAFLGLNLSSDAGGNVDASLVVTPLGTGAGGLVVNGSGGAYFQIFTSGGALEFQPRTAEPDATQTFLIHRKNGANIIETRAGGTLGFFNKTPVGQQNVPLTLPSVQDVIDALVALGLVEQSD